MIAFYSWPQIGLYVITLAFALCVLSQTLATVFSFYRHRSNYKLLIEGFLELSVLVQIICCSLLHGQVIYTYDALLIASVGYGALRTASFIAVAALSLIVMAVTRKWWPLLIITVAGLTLPMVEPLTGRAFAYLYLMAMLFWFIRSIRVCMGRYREITSSISALSVKYAVDSLRTGVMFCEEDGFIVLSNARMQSLMTAITGKIQRNGVHFQELLMKGEIEPNCLITSFEGHSVYLLPDESVWMFTVNNLHIGRKQYSQLTATNITERWELTAELQSQNEELAQRQKELGETIANLHTLSYEQETQRARMRAHDILSERLTLLLRTVRSEQTVDYALLQTLSQRLVDEIKSARSMPSPKDELAILHQTFESIGVEIEVTGNLPEDPAKGQLFVDIAREAVTNAVRHGLATHIHIHIDNTGGDFHLRISDNGQISSGTIKEGGGLSGIRKKLESFQGALTLATEPGFTLIVDLPGGNTNA